MKNIHIREALRVGWKNFAKRPWYLIGISFAVAGLFFLGAGNGTITALAYIICGGYVFLFLRHARGEKVVFDDLFSLDSRWISFAFVGLIKGVLIILGLICFIVPGVYLAVRWMFAEILVVDKGMKPMEALRASSAMTKGHWWKLFGFSAVAALLVLLGLIALLVGAIVASIVVTFAVIQIYETLKGSSTGNTQDVAKT